MPRIPFVASGKTRVLVGTAAADRFFDPARTAEWEQLLRTSRSATCYQSPAFSRPWWHVYGDQHELALVEAVDGHGRLAGQLPLVRTGRGEWRPVGREQSEYPAALARRDDPELTRALLSAARAELGIPALRFLFLPPETPVEGYTQAAVSHLRPHARPLRHFQDAGGPPSKRTKEKLSKLRKLGARPSIATDGEGVARFLEQFVPMHDARQHELGHGTPFRDDPRKQTFLIALAEQGGLIEAAGLFIGSTLAAGMLNVRNGSHLVLSQLAHASELSALSPAACLIHLLTQEYAGTDCTTLDLTPGGEYKERFATAFDTAYALDLAWSPRAVGALLIRRECGPVARRVTERLRQWGAPGTRIGKATA